MKRVLVTGAGGYIGSVLVPKLLKHGFAVRAVDRFFFGAELIAQAPNLEIIREDSRRLKSKHFMNVNAVIDLAAISNDPSGELFEAATWEINHAGRVRTAELSKTAGVNRYLLPSSCSVYGFQQDVVNELSPTNPLTTYARANEQAELGTLALADNHFVVTAFRQATVFGCSPRMRFDLAINGMTYGAYSNHRLPLMRDGSQFRPMVHVQDTTDAMIRCLMADPRLINGEVFNVGSQENTYQLGPLGDAIANTVTSLTGKTVQIEWYGEADHRSYRVDFKKIETTLNWKAKWNASMGCREIVEQLSSGQLEKTDRTITLKWYQELIHWQRIIKNIELHGGILDIDDEQ